jgi:hypothetical protein
MERGVGLGTGGVGLGVVLGISFFPVNRRTIVTRSLGRGLLPRRASYR